MVSVDNIMGVLAVITGIAIFQASTTIGPVQAFIQSNPLAVIIIALFLFFNRRYIAERIKKITGV